VPSAFTPDPRLPRQHIRPTLATTRTKRLCPQLPQSRAKPIELGQIHRVLLRNPLACRTLEHHRQVQLDDPS